MDSVTEYSGGEISRIREHKETAALWGQKRSDSQDGFSRRYLVRMLDDSIHPSLHLLFAHLFSAYFASDLVLVL